MTPTYRAMGKQVLRDGNHFADTRDPDAATALVTLLNATEVEHPADTPDAELAHMREVLW